MQLSAIPCVVVRFATYIENSVIAEEAIEKHPNITASAVYGDAAILKSAADDISISEGGDFYADAAIFTFENAVVYGEAAASPPLGGRPW